MVAPEIVRTTIASLERHPPFDRMETATLQFLAGRLSIAYYPAGEAILGPAAGVVDRLRIVKQGRVRGSAGEGAAGEVDLLLGPGESFPIGALAGRRATSFDYRAETDVFCFELPAQDFAVLLERSEVFSRYCTGYLSALLDRSHRALRAQLAEQAADEGRLVAPLRTLIRRAPAACPPGTPVGTVLETMRNERVGSMVIADAAGVPLGIFTQPDALARVALGGVPLSAPIERVMTPNPVTLAAEAPAFEAAVAMARHGIRHVVLVEDGRLAGVVSERDLFALQRTSLRRVAERVRGGGSVESVIEAAAETRALARNLLAQGMDAEHLTQVTSALNDALTQQIIAIRAREFGLGSGWCWLALGSEGRLEQTLATDQDNALLLAGADERALEFADAVNRTLDAAGFPLCRGEIMARNPKWCLTLDEWRAQFDDWIRNPLPEALLNACIFFDFRPLAGEATLAGMLRDWLLALVPRQPAFLRAMAANACRTRVPLGLIRDFTPEDDGPHAGTIDLKAQGARIFVDAARIRALAGGVADTATAARLRAAVRTGALPADEGEAAVSSFHFLQGLRLRRQHFGSPPPGAENRIDPESLNALDRRILKESLRQAARLQERLRLDYQI